MADTHESHDSAYSHRVTLAWLQVQRPVTAYVASMIPQRADADDVIQAVALAMCDKLDTYDPNRPLLRWVLSIARHKVIDYYRQNTSRPKIFDSAVLDAIEQAFERNADQNDEMIEALVHCIEKLSNRQRYVLEMRYRVGCKPAEIVEQTGLSTTVVYGLLKRARQALRRCIERQLQHIRMEPDS